MSDTSLRAFVSYSRTSGQHTNKIFGYCERLKKDGIDTIIDAGTLKPGHELNAFIERILDTDIPKVIVFSDKRYARSADKRLGGVGYEAQLLSHDLKKNQHQTRIIAVVCENFEDGSPCLPKFLQPRWYIDFSSPQLETLNWKTLTTSLKTPEAGSLSEYKSGDANITSTQPLKELLQKEGWHKATIEGTLHKNPNVSLTVFLENWHDPPTYIRGIFGDRCDRAFVRICRDNTVILRTMLAYNSIESYFLPLPLAGTLMICQSDDMITQILNSDDDGTYSSYRKLYRLIVATQTH